MTLSLRSAERFLFCCIAFKRQCRKSESFSWAQRAFYTLQSQVDKQDAAFSLQWCLRGHDNAARPTSLQWERVPTEDRIQWLLVRGWKDSDLAAGKDPAVLAIAASSCRPTANADTLEIAVKMELLPKGIPSELQSKLVDLCKKAFVELDGLNGYITTDFVSANVYGSMSPYERSVGLSFPAAARQFDKHSRGYYWGNFLSSELVDLMGGSSEMQKAPGILVEKVADRGYFIQLTDDLNGIDQAKLRELGQFMAPILPQGYEQSNEYYEALPDFLL